MNVDGGADLSPRR